MKFNFKNYSSGSRFSEFLRSLNTSVISFFKNVKTSYLLTSKRERIAAFSLLSVSVILLAFKFYQVYMVETKIVPSSGGEYTEAVVGEVKYLDPVLVQTDEEKSLSELLFSGLVSVNDAGMVTPDLSDSYDISPDGTVYTFHLKDNVLFSDGLKLTADDIAYTLSRIQAPETKSPMQKTFANVDVSVTDDNTITLTLPNAYGPFIYNCTFGVLPSHLTPDDFSKEVVGSGPYKYSKSHQKNGIFTDIELAKNGQYYGVKPLIEKVKVTLFAQKDDAKKAYEGDKSVLGLFGTDSNVGAKFNYKTSKQLGLIFNLRNDSVKDVAVRQKIVDGGTFDTEMTLNMTTLDAPIQRQKALELKDKFKSQNINLNVTYLSAVKLPEALTAKNYDLLLYGFDFGFDRDPYTFWHSSQLSAQNYAGWSDKKSDILLEDARMLSDTAQRNAKYDQFYQTVRTNYLAVFYDPVEYNFYLKDDVKNAAPVLGNQAYSRYNSLLGWYLETTRVKK